MAGNAWNPHADPTLGLEWLADLWGDWNLGTDGPFAQRIRSRSAETINQLTAYLRQQSNALADLLLMEIIPAGSEIPSGLVTQGIYQPDADATAPSPASSTYKMPGGLFTNIWQAIDETVAAVNAADYVHVGSGNFVERFATAAFPTTARVLKVELALVSVVNDPDDSISLEIRLRHTPSVTDYTFIGYTNGYLVPAPASQATTIIDLGEINPRTKLPWTPADIIGFDTGTALYGIYVGTPTSSSGASRLLAMELRVTYQTVENRVAAASYAKPASVVADGPQSSGAFVALPAAGASWAKPAAGDFTVLFRIPRSVFAAAPVQTAAMSLPWASSTIDGVEILPSVPGVASARPLVDGYGQIAIVDFASTVAARTVPLLVVTSAPATSPDSLPYFLVDDTTRLPGVNNAQTVTQQFTPGTNGDYRIVRFLVRPGAATGDLTVKLKRQSDNVQFGSTVTVTAAEVAALDEEANSLKLVQVRLASVGALVSGTEYYVEFTSADTSTLGLGWQVVAPGSASLSGGLASFAGTVGVATIAGAAQDYRDVAVTVSTQPETLTGAALVVQERALGGIVAACGVPTVEELSVSWTASALGALFLRYEVQRSDDLGVTWDDVAHGLTEATAAWTDQEPQRGVPTMYRVRVVRVDGIGSEWADTVSRTAAIFDAEMIFVTNEEPGLAVAYNYEPLIEAAFLAAARDQIIEIADADYAVAFSEAEDPGLSFPVTLTVNGGEEPAVDGLDAFDPLRAISRATVSYVCVLTRTGDRYYVHLQVPEGSWTEDGFMYKSTVLVTEITGSPSVVEF